MVYDLEKIQNYPIDQIDTGKKLARFLGLVGYYRTFIREFSVLTAEFNQLKGCTVVKLSDLQKDKLRKLLDNHLNPQPNFRLNVVLKFRFGFQSF